MSTIKRLCEDLHYKLRDALYWAEHENWGMVKQRIATADECLEALSDMLNPEPPACPDIDDDPTVDLLLENVRQFGQPA